MEERASDPYCIACGGLVGFEDVYGSRSRRYLVDHDIELDPTNPLDWGGVYRAVFQPWPSSRFRISNIWRYDGRYYDANFRGYLKATWEGGLNNVHQPQTNEIGDEAGFHEMNFFDSNNEQQYPHGHVVHAHCWVLVERIVGREAENNLDLLLEICRGRFHENPYDIHEYQDLEVYQLEPTSQLTRRWWNPLGLVPPLDPSRHHPDVHEDPRQSIPLRDPLNIPDIPRLIRRSAQNKAREATKRKTRKWSSSAMSSSSLSSRKHRRSIHYYQVTELSCELVFWVLDNLSHHTDIRNALIAFNWKVPEVYWKGRVPRDLIFELQDEKQPPGNLDWKFLCLGIMELMEQQPNLRNRKRVMGLIDEIRRRFWERMAESDSSIKQGRLN